MFTFALLTVAVIFALIVNFYLVLRQGHLLMREAKQQDELKVEGEEDFGFIEDDVKVESHEQWTQRGFVSPPPPPNFLFKLKIALTFLQIMSNLSFSVEIPWPSKFRALMSSLSFFNFDFIRITSVDCIFETNYYRRLLIVSLTPLLLFAVVFILYLLPKYCAKTFPVLVRKIWIKFFGESDEASDDPERVKMARKRSRRRFWRMLIFALFLIWPTVSSTVLRLYVCRKVVGTWYLVQDYRIQCYTSTWNAYAAFGSIMLAVCS